MTFTSIAILFSTMAVLSAIPSVSVFTVSARAATHGFSHGALTALGIVVADLLFIALALFGLAFLADTFEDLFIWIKYLGGAYLIWLGISLWQSKALPLNPEETNEASLVSSFLAGLLLTLADQKAIFFYLGFFPAFIDLTDITPVDIFTILLITIIAVGGVKLGYAFFASKAKLLLATRVHKTINLIAGSVMIAIGAFLIGITL